MDLARENLTDAKEHDCITKIKEETSTRETGQATGDFLGNTVSGISPSMPVEKP